MRAITLAYFLMGLAITGSALAAEPKRRMTPAEIDAVAPQGAGAGTSGILGITTSTLSGDPSKPGPYTVRIFVPAHTTIQAHSHRDDRVAVVTSGTWYFGYGLMAARHALKALPPGSFYTEPARQPHFARTGDEPVTVVISGLGPTDTVYVDPTKDPIRR